MKTIALAVLLATAGLSGPVAAADGDTEVTLLFGISFLDAHVEHDQPFDIMPLLPPNFPRGFDLPSLRIREKSAIGGSALFGFGVAHRIGARAWIEGDLAIAPTHHLERDSSITCAADVCALLTSVRPDAGRGGLGGPRETVVAYHYGLALAYELTRGEVRPYLSVGAGGVSYDTSARTETDFSFDVGAGVRLRLDRGVGARIEVVDRITPDHFLTGRTEHDPQIRAGVTFRP